MANRPEGAEIPGMVMSRFRALSLGVAIAQAFALAACGQAPPTGTKQPATFQPGNQGGQPGPAGTSGVSTTSAASDDLRFTITFTFNTQPGEPNVWNAGTFTTTGTVSTALIEGLGETRTYIGDDWPSSGMQQFGDYFCNTPDECLEPCVGSYDSQWQDEPYIGKLESAGGHVTLDALLHANPQPIEEPFLRSANDCPPATNNGLDGFPPMHITIDGLGGASAPTYSIEPYQFDGTQPPAPGDVWKLTITPIP